MPTHKYTPVTAIGISHQGSAGCPHEFKEDISENSTEARLTGALRLAMANLFLSMQYDLSEMFRVLEFIKKAPSFKASSVRQDIETAPPGRPYKMTIRFAADKSSIHVTVWTGDRTLNANTKNKCFQKTIEMIQYLEEEYPCL